MRVYVATDLWGRKDNVEFPFDGSAPLALATLTHLVESVFAAEALAQCPTDVPVSSVPSFRIACMLILRQPVSSLDGGVGGWEEVSSAAELFDGCQLFVFQPQHPYHSDAQGRLPVPRRMSDIHPPPPIAAPSQLLTPLDAAHLTFRLLEPDGSAVLRTGELKGALLRVGLDLHEFDGRFLFDDRAAKPYLTLREWLSFAEHYPNAIALLAHRLGGVLTQPSDLPEKADKRLSPPRNTASTEDQRQRIASERLAAGLSCIAVAKDRRLEASQGTWDPPVHVAMEARAAQTVTRERTASSHGTQLRRPGSGSSRGKLSPTGLSRRHSSSSSASGEWAHPR